MNPIELRVMEPDVFAELLDERPSTETADRIADASAGEFTRDGDRDRGPQALEMPGRDQGAGPREDDLAPDRGAEIAQRHGYEETAVAVLVDQRQDEGLKVLH